MLWEIASFCQIPGYEAKQTFGKLMNLELALNVYMKSNVVYFVQKVQSITNGK
jgi:hypothetical protein